MGRRCPPNWLTVRLGLDQHASIQLDQMMVSFQPALNTQVFGHPWDLFMALPYLKMTVCFASWQLLPAWPAAFW